MKRYCLALDLKNNPSLISEYEAHHRNVWPEIIRGLRESGIQSMEIFRTGNRLFMIMETTDQFSLDQKVDADMTSPKVQEWETLMWKYQQALPGAKPGEKWVVMNRIFQL